MLNDHFRQALIDCDVALCRKIMAHVYPHLPQPADEAEALFSVHYARTAAVSIPFKLRAYSHAWLTERAMPSGLPDDMKPLADRLYPRIVEGVGIAIKAPPHRQDVARECRMAMEYVVNDCYANGDRDPVLVKRLMVDARRKIIGR